MGHSLFLIFNHEITSLQQEDAIRSLGVNRIIDLPEDYKRIWSNVPPELDEIEDYLEPVQTWLSQESSKKDLALIQGDFGATYIMVNFAFSLGLVPVYSTTNREALERHNTDGSVEVNHHFRHHLFRKYGV